MPRALQLLIRALIALIAFHKICGHPQQKTWKMTLGSCLHPSWRPWLSLSSIAHNQPDAVFLLGDLIYVDYDAVSLEWERPGYAHALSEGDLAGRFNKVWDLTMSEPNFAALLNSSADICCLG